MSRFTIVGIVAACIHIGIVWVLIAHVRIETLLANLSAFMLAFIVSFTGQYVWTFRSTLHWQKAIIRFLLISLLGFAANNVVLISLLDVQLISDSHAAILAACVIPLITYISARIWAFK